MRMMFTSIAMLSRSFLRIVFNVTGPMMLIEPQGCVWIKEMLR